MTKYAFIIPIILLLAGLTQTPTTIAGPQDGWQWSVLEVVSTSSNNDVFSPSITTDTKGNVHIVWSDNTFNMEDGGDYDVFYKKWESTTKSWGNTESITIESTENSFSPIITSDKLDNLHVVWYDYTDYLGSGTDADILYRTWNSSSQIWESIEVVSTESTGQSYAPAIVADNLNNIHVVWYDNTDIYSSGADYDIFYKKMNAASHSWDITEMISIYSIESSSHPTIDCDYLGNIHVVWMDASDILGAGEDTDVFYIKLEKASQSWGTNEVVSSISTSFSNYPVLKTDYMGNIHIAWSDTTNYDGSGVDSDIFYIKWDINGQAWDTTEVVSTESADEGHYHSMEIDDFGNIHMVWNDNSIINQAGWETDIFYKRKGMDETGWSTITTVLSGTIDLSTHPDLTVDESQFVHVVWSDTTNYSNSGDDYDILYRKLLGNPQMPLLELIEPNPSNGIIDLKWDKIFSASSYSIYRSLYPIYSTDGLKSIAGTSDTHYVDQLDEGGTYYYAITANNPEGSTLSNTVYATVQIGDDTVTETITENNNLTSIVTELATEYLNGTNSDEATASFPVSIPPLFGSITLIILIQRKRKY